MMHGLGMGSFEIGSCFFGLLPLILLGGGLYVLLRAVGPLDGSRRQHAMGGRGRSLAPTQRLVVAEIFRLAKRHGGIITVSDAVSELGINPEDAEELLKGLTDGNRVDMEVESSGIVRYVFREFSA